MLIKYCNILIILLFVFLFFNSSKGEVLDSTKLSKATKSSSSRNKLIVLPAVLHSPVTRWGVGVGSSFLFKTKQNDTTLRTSNIEALALYTQNNQYLGVLGLNFYSPRETYIVRWRNTFSYFPDRFWGLGNNTLKNDYKHYIFEQFLINPQILRRVYKKIYIGVNYEFQNVFKFEYYNQPIFNNVAGINGGKVSGLGMTLAWDTRNNAFSSTKGAFLQLSIVPFRHWLGSDFHFTAVNIDLRKYLTIFREHVLAFQLIGVLNTGDVPIRNLAALGGSDIMRGYYAGRYRDKNMAAMQAEYRSPIWWRIGFVLFGGFGEVFNNINIKQKNLVNAKGRLKYSLGGGLRFSVRKHERLNLRLDYGIGYHSAGFYFTVAESF
jgi:outer membrane protein assembly factor BamA